ncbi:TPA: hypothetical protein R4T04_001897 [Enterobacter asburiae]|nr:hypothetical protein [Enterobacter hormaechei subsp. steigerwaltii]HED1620311.1 hypothetical protein [Enterobacter asburiae]
MMMFPSIKAFLIKCCSFCRGEQVQGQKVKDILNDDVLIRTLFDSEHYNRDLNELENNAIPTSDLKERGLSLDIKRLASESAVLKRVNIQKGRAQEKNGPDDRTRKNVFFSEVEHPKVNDILDTDGVSLFLTKYAPVEGNDAHAMLMCCKNNKTKAYYVMARNKLMPVFSERITPAQDYTFLNK